MAYVWVSKLKQVVVLSFLRVNLFISPFTLQILMVVRINIIKLKMLKISDPINMQKTVSTVDVQSKEYYKRYPNNYYYFIIIQYYLSNSHHLVYS